MQFSLRAYIFLDITTLEVHCRYEVPFCPAKASGILSKNAALKFE